MAEIKIMIKFWTIADFNEEEDWLRNLHKEGWKFTKLIPPCFYTFEKCEPEDVIYRLDYKNNKESSDYMQLLKDYGWEYAGKCVGWIYFRKPALDLTNENDGQLFSDNESRIEKVESLVKTRLIPFCIIFLCSVIPNAIRALDGDFGLGFSFFWGLMFSIYVIIILHCGIKLKRMRKELEL